MARNRGKRPGAASASSSPSQSQARDAQVKAGETEGKASAASSGSGPSASEQATSKAPVAASKAIAAKVETPLAVATTTTSAAKASGDASKIGGDASKIGGDAPKIGGDAPKTGGDASKTGSPSRTGSSAASRATTQASATTSQTSRAQAGGSTAISSSAASGGAAAGSGAGRNDTASSDGGGGGGFLPGLIGGVIGGAATALAALLFWGGGDQSATTALEDRLAVAEQQVSQIDGLNDRVAAVEAAPADAADDGGMAQRLDDLETRLAELGSASPGNASGTAADSGFGERVTSLEQRLETFSALEQRIEALAGEVQAVGETQSANVQALTSLESALPTFEETLAATGVTVGQASDQTTALNQTVESLSGDVGTLATRVNEAESKLDHLGGEYQRGAAMIVAIGDINRAVTRAEPFDHSLQTLKLLVRDDAALGDTLSALEPVAADGVPTLGGLKNEFGQMASRVMLAEGGDPSLTDKVSNNVFGIFNMRPAGADVEGSGSRAILSRAQSKLSADDLEGAMGELAGLEEGAAEAAAAWIERAGARLAAEAAVLDLRAHAQGLVAQGS